MTEVIKHTLPKKENHQLADELLARFPGVDHTEILKDLIAHYFREMRWGNKREERAACDFLNEVQKIALRIAAKNGLLPEEPAQFSGNPG